MKLLVLLFLVGFAAASEYAALEEAAEQAYQDFMLGMESAGSLKSALGLPDDHFYADHAEDDANTELGKKLREQFDQILEKIKDGIEKGKTIREDYLEKLKEIRQKLKEIKMDLGTKAKELLEKMKNKVGDYFRDLLDKISGKSERSIQDWEINEVHADFNLKELFRKLRKSLLEKIDKEKLKAKIEEIFGKGNEMADALLNIINEKGDKYKSKLLELIDRFLGKDSKERRSLKEYMKKIIDDLKNKFGIELKEKYFKLAEWIKNRVSDSLDASKSKLENIKQIGREALENAKDMRKDVMAELLDFMRPYKEDMKSLWEQLKETSKDIFNKQS